jgi:predicted RNase H-like HicB family nuclease
MKNVIALITVLLLFGCASIRQAQEREEAMREEAIRAQIAAEEKAEEPKREQERLEAERELKAAIAGCEAYYRDRGQAMPDKIREAIDNRKVVPGMTQRLAIALHGVFGLEDRSEHDMADAHWEVWRFMDGYTFYFRDGLVESVTHHDG